MSGGETERLSASFVVVGGGIAGVSCAEALAVLRPQDDVILLSASSLIKAATNVQPLTKYLVKFEVEEQSAEALTQRCPTVRVVQDTVVALHPAEGPGGEGVLVTESGRRVTYGRLCVCAGARPKPILADHPLVLTVRDTESVRALQARVAGARRVLVVGNGGIATELVHELRDVEVVWVVRHDHISAAFVDAGAAEFLMPAAKDGADATEEPEHAVKPVVKRMRFTEAQVGVAEAPANSAGAALGPDWHARWELRGRHGGRLLRVEYGCEVVQVRPGDEGWPAHVELSNGAVVAADLVVSATGVVPNVEAFARDNPGLRLGEEDGGILVDEHMRSSVPGVFAAGDACTAGWAHAKHWFQMRLWTQARQMGTYAARCMAADAEGEHLLQDFCFEMFTHVTRFFGHKVVLLGLHNGQKLEGGDWEMMLRAVKGKEYVKLVLQHGRVQGAVLIGDTDLEETFENLILDQVDVSHLGEDLLNPHVDVEDYFD